MWHDHPFNQRNMTSERAAGLGVGGDTEMGARGPKFEKWG